MLDLRNAVKNAMPIATAENERNRFIKNAVALGKDKNNDSGCSYLCCKMGRYLCLGVIGLVVIACVICINNMEANNITVVDTIELVCNINLSEDNEISIYKLTVAGYLRTDDAYAGEVPPMVFQSFDLITDGSIKSIENIALFARSNGSAKEIQYDIAYAVLEAVQDFLIPCF